MSYISPWAGELVASLEKSRRLREATGESPLPSVKLWPVRLLDAVQLIHIEGIKQHNAEFEADNES